VLQARYLRRVGEHEQVEFIERERHAVAIHEACHATIAYLKRRSMEIDFVSIEPGGDYLGVVMSMYDDQTFLSWRSTFEIDAMVSLGSLAGERMFFDGDSSSGVSGDLESATAVATNMEGIWGMGSTVSSYSTSTQLGLGTPGGPSKGEKNELNARRALADRIEDNLAEMLERTTAILKENRREVLALAHALETHKTLTGEDVIAVLEGRPGPIIDGSAYSDGNFLAELERYHRAALDAHRSHAKLAAALPARPGSTAVAEASTSESVWRNPQRSPGDEAVAPAPSSVVAGNGSAPAPDNNAHPAESAEDAAPPHPFGTQ